MPFFSPAPPSAPPSRVLLHARARSAAVCQADDATTELWLEWCDCADACPDGPLDDVGGDDLDWAGGDREPDTWEPTEGLVGADPDPDAERNETGVERTELVRVLRCDAGAGGRGRVGAPRWCDTVAEGCDSGAAGFAGVFACDGARLVARVDGGSMLFKGSMIGGCGRGYWGKFEPALATALTTTSAACKCTRIVITYPPAVGPTRLARTALWSAITAKKRT
jgi:hypothetical protein